MHRQMMPASTIERPCHGQRFYGDSIYTIPLQFGRRDALDDFADGFPLFANRGLAGELPWHLSFS